MRRRTEDLNLTKKVMLASIALSVVATPVLLGWTRTPIVPAAAAERAPAIEPGLNVIVPSRSHPKHPNVGAGQIYPPESKAAREEGTAVLLLTVDATGDVIDAKVDQSSGHERLDAASRAAAIDL